MNLQQASKELICNNTCINHVGFVPSDGKADKVWCRACVEKDLVGKIGEHAGIVLRPKAGTCNFHSLKGYGGGVSKSTTTDKYAEAYNSKIPLWCVRKEKEDK